jgi:hypothetical protein
MIRFWLGLALLSGSWLFGLSYVQPANPWIWLIFVVAGVALLSGRPKLRTSPRQIGWAAVLLLPAVWLLPWPYRVAPLLATIGLALQLPNIPARWPKAVGRGALWAGTILLSQSVLLELYQYQTARCHDLPRLLVWLLAGAMQLTGVDAAATSATANGAAIAIRSMGGPYRIAATWELLIDPATFCFVVGGFVLLGIWVAAHAARGERWREWLAGARVLTVFMLVWLPVRAVLFVSLYLHRVMMEDTERASLAANQFVNAWPYVLLLAGPVLLAARFVRLSAPASGTGEGNHDAVDEEVVEAIPVNVRRVRYMVLSLSLLAAVVAVFTFCIMWTPVGSRREGRVMVVDRHSTWEPTTRPYDTNWFGEIASYNYAAAYEYLSQYYEMSRLLESDRIDNEHLQACDILVIKIPTARFEPEEVDAICEFVEQGGSLLLVGDHTNVFNCSTYLNDIARRFGFVYRNDLLFQVGSPYKQRYRRPLIPHPAVQHVPWMDYAVSCSIDPGHSSGDMVLRAAGLWNLPPDYNASNFHPQAEHRPEMQLGAWCQAWTTTHGTGRVLAFSDSTLFSNFCTFQEGKAELLRSMIEYLNHDSVFDRSWLRHTVSAILLVIAVALLVGAVWLGRGQSVNWGLGVSAAVMGWSVAALAVIVVHRASLPVPPKMDKPKAEKLTHVVIDRTLSDVPLSHGAFPQGDGEGYGLFEQWIPRLDNYTSRKRGLDVFDGDVLVIIEPTQSVSRRYRDAFVKYIEAGGRALIVESPDNFRTPANSLLWPFDMELAHAGSMPGTLRIVGDWPGTELEAGSEVIGGEPIATIDGRTVAAQAKRGKGTVTVIGFGYLFTDAYMGQHWMPDPEEETIATYRILFTLLEAAIEGKPPGATWATAASEEIPRSD